MILRVLNETATTVTVGWVSFPGAAGYVFTVDGLRKSSTLDGSRVSARFSKPDGGPHTYGVSELVYGEQASLVVPVVTPPSPPSATKLRSAPPGFAPGSADKSLYDPNDPANYPGFVVIDFPWLSYPDLGSKDVFVRPFDLSELASKTSGRMEGGFKNGRHVVAIAGRLSCRNTNNVDDATPLQVQGGDPTGIVHLEGIDGDTVNGVTVRTGRTVRQQNCRWNLETWQHDHSRIHPDWTQVWTNLGAGSPRLQAHRVTVTSDYTGLSCLEPPDPSSGELYDVQLTTVGDGIYPASGGQPHNVCKWTLGNVWFKPVAGKLDDHWGYTDHNQYLLISADGSRQWASGPNKVGGSGGATSIGGSQGDVWRCTEGGAGLYGQEVRYGIMPTGDPCAADAGIAYRSPGYV